jgi:hypothetical protein
MHTSSVSLAKSCDDPKIAKEHMQSMFGPQVVDQQVRQAISMCWMMLPDDQKSVERVESEIQRIVARALKNLREDCQSFGIPNAPTKA